MWNKGKSINLVDTDHLVKDKNYTSIQKKKGGSHYRMNVLLSSFIQASRVSLSLSSKRFILSSSETSTRPRVL